MTVDDMTVRDVTVVGATLRDMTVREVTVVGATLRDVTPAGIAKRFVIHTVPLSGIRSA